MENLGNDFATTLAAAITTVGQTAISVVSGTGAPAVNFRIRIGDELMLVTSKGSGTDWTVTRNIEGTTATTHLNGADVAHVVTFGGIDAYGDENFASIFPGAAAGKTRLVPVNHQLNVVEQLILDGELILEGEVNILPLL